MSNGARRNVEVIKRAHLEGEVKVIEGAEDTEIAKSEAKQELGAEEKRAKLAKLVGEAKLMGEKSSPQYIKEKAAHTLPLANNGVVNEGT